MAVFFQKLRRRFWKRSRPVCKLQKSWRRLGFLPWRCHKFPLTIGTSHVKKCTIHHSSCASLPSGQFIFTGAWPRSSKISGTALECSTEILPDREKETLRSPLYNYSYSIRFFFLPPPDLGRRF